VNGNLHIQSSMPLDCSAFQKMSANGNIGGSFLCEEVGSRPVGTNPPTSTATATASSHWSARLSDGAKGGIIAGSVIGALTLVALVAFLVISRRRKASSTSDPSTKQAAGSTDAADRKQFDSHEKSFGTRQERAELVGSPEQTSDVRGHAELVAHPNQVSELHC
jgi:predicted lipid-binding transport protein (Tim44 family)